MIKAVGKDHDGTPVLMLGLSYANLRRLKDDEPIAFDATPYGFNGRILIYAGPTEAAMARAIQRGNPDVEVNEETDAP